MLAISSSGELLEPIITTLSFALFGLIANWVVYKRGFFKLPPLKEDFRNWSFSQCVVCFAIYLIDGAIIAPILFNTVLNLSQSMGWDALNDQRAKLILLQTLDIAANIFFLSLYVLFQKKGSLKNLWKDPQMKQHGSYFYDVLLGFFTWFISFPLIIAINSFCELINQFVFKSIEVDQVAVKFLKLSASSLTTVIISILMIIIAAPLIEEFLFRGCIQNWLRKHVGTSLAVILTSAIFSLMHYAPSQGASNFPLLVSLFSFSLYLGFLYEKTRCLLAPIVLHLTFNGISVIRILSS
jgi:membrane protease YdiL (CAAX protease family)